MQRTIRAAVIQAGSVAGDSAAGVESARRWIAEASAAGATLAVLPEAFLGGYPKGADFGARVGSRSDEGRREFRRYFESAIEVPGAETEALGNAAREHGVFVVAGVIERNGGTLYCTVLFFAADGALLGKHRKVMPTGVERLIWGWGDGSTLPVFDCGGFKVGAVICWENYMPLLRMAMYAQGIEIYCAPTVDDRETWVSTMRHIALEGRCFVLSACQVTDRIRGGSLIVNPRGELLAGPEYGRECVLTADLDRDRIAEGKFDLDVAGHYARPDIFQLSVNREPQEGVR